MEKVILFDLDGTLIDSTKAIVDTFLYVFDKYNFKFNKTEEDIKKLIGYPLFDMFRAFGVEKNTQEFVDSYKLRYREISKDFTTLLPFAKESLELAKKDAILGIVTTKTRRYTTPLLEHLEILDYFSEIIGFEDVTNCKPSSEPIEKILKLLNIRNTYNNIFLIGDTKLDLIASNRAKIRGIGVLSGYGTEEELQDYSPYIFKNSLEAVQFIYQ